MTTTDKDVIKVFEFFFEKGGYIGTYKGTSGGISGNVRNFTIDVDEIRVSQDLLEDLNSLLTDMNVTYIINNINGNMTNWSFFLGTKSGFQEREEIKELI